jgi:hypothetical protein
MTAGTAFRVGLAVVALGAAVAAATGVRRAPAAAPARLLSAPAPAPPMAFDLSRWVGKGLGAMQRDPVLGPRIRAALGERQADLDTYLPDLAHMRAEKGPPGFLVLAGGLDADRNGFLFVSDEGHATLAFYHREGGRARVRLFSSDPRYVSRVAPLLPELTTWFAGDAPVSVSLRSPWEMPEGGGLPPFLAAREVVAPGS